MGSFFSVFLDLVIIGLLVATIVYAVRLNKRLSSLRDSREDLQKMTVEFQAITTRVEDGIRILRKTATEVADTLQSTIVKAQELRDELSFMVESADNLANRIEGAIKPARAAVSELANSMPQDGENTASAGTALPAEPQNRPSAEARSRVERDLIQAIENIVR